jgi:hypothetical protein
MPTLFYYLGLKFSFYASVSLSNAAPAQRNRYSLSPFGIHWAEIDEDLCFGRFWRK